MSQFVFKIMVMPGTRGSYQGGGGGGGTNRIILQFIQVSHLQMKISTSCIHANFSYQSHNSGRLIAP